MRARKMDKSAFCAESCIFHEDGICSLSVADTRHKCPGENGAIVKAMREYDREHPKPKKNDWT